MGTIEHRRLFRAIINLKLTYEIPEASLKGVLLTNNLSSSGAQVVGCHEFRLGEEVQLKAHLDEGKIIVPVLAKVVWQKKCNYSPPSRKIYFATGFRFLDISPQDAILTSDFIYETLKRQNELEEKEMIDHLETMK